MERVADIKRRAQTFLKNGQWTEAIRTYEKLAESSEQDPYLEILIGDVHLRRGALPDAMTQYMKAVQGYRDSGLLKNAIALCKKILRLDHQKVQVLGLLAELNAQDGLAGESAVCYLAAAEEDLVVGEKHNAVQQLERAVSVAPTHADCSRRLVDLHIEMGNPGAAARELLRLAEALRFAGREEPVRFLLERARELDPTAELPVFEGPVSEAPSHDLSSVLESHLHPASDVPSGSAPDSVAGFESTHLSQPETPQPESVQAESGPEAAPEPVAEAESTPAPTVAQSATPVPTTPAAPIHEPPPRDTYSVSIRDEAPATDGPLVDLSEILSEFKQSLENQISPDDARSHYDMAMAYLDMNLLGDAIAELAAASRDHALRPKCCEMLGVCYLRQGSPADAQRFLERGLETEGVDEDGRLSLQYHLAEAHAQQGDTLEALELLEEVVRIRPDFLDASERLEACRLRRAS